MKKDFVSYKVAQMLKANGFNEPCRAYFRTERTKEPAFSIKELLLADLPEGGMLCPTQPEAIQWIRENYHFAVVVLPVRYPMKFSCWLVYCNMPKEMDDKLDMCELRKRFDAFEDAENYGITEALKIVTVINKALKEGGAL